jgi:hypothetical protein
MPTKSPFPSATPAGAAPDWPAEVSAPGNPDWQRSAVRWLRDLLPARYAGYPTLVRHHTVLARHAELQVHHEIRAVRAAFQTSRAELPRLGVSEQTVENTIRLYAGELEHLVRTARAVRLIRRALLEESRARRPAGAAPSGGNT